MVRSESFRVKCEDLFCGLYMPVQLVNNLYGIEYNGEICGGGETLGIRYILGRYSWEDSLTQLSLGKYI